ncbi:YcbK family protein [Paracraurococcus lichenis]|uniref:Murein endopeptidase K n=1 Tax=Paracraurococcus lichenis TaxID=3064888 RepID=A0ABT9E835_9PROT|nr:DUF882 domain-containing protein [Paracraurococcus sp. LOR1-02]MDO9712345.1 DUF882 domain-containing protein [Paracraurococcus sp. LOR1-02]
MTRRTFLLAAAAVALGPHGAWAATRRVGPVARRLSLRHLATGDRFDGPWHDGRAPDPAAMADLSQVLADSRTHAVMPFDPMAIEVLWEVARRARLAGPLTILSGYRTPETNRFVHGAGDSQHLRAGAVDVLLPAEQVAGFGEQALKLGRGGVGIYARRSFVHLDSGPVRAWGDLPDGVALAHAKPVPVDPLAKMAEAWAQTRLP